MRLVTISLIGLLSGTPLLAQIGVPVEQEQEPVIEREHLVRVGDTLWDLASYYFDDPFQWRTIYQANESVVASPHWIYPAQVLKIPGVTGAPAAAPQRVATRAVESRPLRTVFYRQPPPRPQSETDPTLLLEPGLEVLPVKEGEFLSAAYLLDPDLLAVRGRFLRSVRDIRPGPGAHPSSHPQDRVYIEYAGARPAIDDRLVVADVGRRVEGAGREARIIRPRGIVRITALDRELMEGQLEQQYGPVYPGQILIPVPGLPEFEVEAAVSLEGGSDRVGRILGFVDEQPMYGPTSHALVNLGQRHGVQVGDIFEAYLPVRTEREGGLLRSRSEILPPEAVAELRVVRVTDLYATLIVDHVWLPRLEPDLPVRRVRKIP